MSKNTLWPKEWKRTNKNVAIWWVMENREPTEDDYDALAIGMKNVGVTKYDVDDLSLVGRYHADWTTAEDVEDRTPPEQMDGGLGSNIYEMQNLTPGGKIAEKKIWIHGDDDSMTKMIPPNSGLYHVDNHQVARAGAEPDSPADKYVGDKELHFDGMWIV
jgi:hypothetical protein